MTRWTITLFFTAVLASTVARGQVISRKDTAFIGYKGDSIVRKNDTTSVYFKNGCLSEKGTWDYKDKINPGRWIGKYFQYYESPCGQLFNEILYDNHGKLIWSKAYDEKGKLIGERKAPDK